MDDTFPTVPFYLGSLEYFPTSQFLRSVELPTLRLRAPPTSKFSSSRVFPHHENLKISAKTFKRRKRTVCWILRTAFIVSAGEDAHLFQALYVVFKMFSSFCLQTSHTTVRLSLKMLMFFTLENYCRNLPHCHSYGLPDNFRLWPSLGVQPTRQERSGKYYTSWMKRFKAERVIKKESCGSFRAKDYTDA